jgi:hypothetical protein
MGRAFTLRATGRSFGREKQMDPSPHVCSGHPPAAGDTNSQLSVGLRGLCDPLLWLHSCERNTAKLAFATPNQFLVIELCVWC